MISFFEAITRILTPPSSPLPPPSSGGSVTTATSTGNVAPPARPKSLYVGVLNDKGTVGTARAFVRFKISDLPASVVSVRLRWRYVNKALPTANVSLIEIEDFGTLEQAAWGTAERATITTTAITPATTIDTTLSIDVTARYNQAKADGLAVFACKLQYGTEDEGVGIGRWYQVGATGTMAPQLVLTVSAGHDLNFTLLATPLVVNLAYADGLGGTVGVVTAGDSDYPPLGPEVQLGATLDGLTDDGSGTYTGTAGALIENGADIAAFLLRDTVEGCGLADAKLDLTSFETSRTRLADWFPLAGGVIERRNVLDWITEVARSCRSFRYLDQQGRETFYTEPTGGDDRPPVRHIEPDEHGAIAFYPLAAETGALYPVSKVEVFYGFDYLGLAEWQGHALISAEEVSPADAIRQAQAVIALDRYGVRDLAGLEPEANAETGYGWVPLEAPGTQTGVRLRDWLWDAAQARVIPAGNIAVQLPRFALTFRLMDAVDITSMHFPSAAARVWPTSTPAIGALEPGPLAYQGRRARCSVREMPRLLPESGSEFPVQVVLRIVTWDTV